MRFVNNLKCKTSSVGAPTLKVMAEYSLQMMISLKRWIKMRMIMLIQFFSKRRESGQLESNALRKRELSILYQGDNLLQRLLSALAKSRRIVVKPRIFFEFFLVENLK
jgi:hypothetical protein